MKQALLSVRGLTVDARTPQGLRRVLDSVSFDLNEGETLCLAGESGSGKSVTSLAIMGLLPGASLRVSAGEILFDGQSLLTLPQRALRHLRGGDIAMIFQEPMTSLNPIMTIGAQMAEAIRAHGRDGQESAEVLTRQMLDAVHMNDAARRLTQYPHELSGGMRQRVMIAMALSCRPKVLIADEPTTALDVTVQAQILTLLRELRREFSTSILLITHDMGVVAEMADRVAVMRGGRLEEQGDSLDIFERPQQDYTRQLLAAVPRLGSLAGTDAPPRITAPTGESPVLSTWPVLDVQGLCVSYARPRGWLGRGAEKTPNTVESVSFSIPAGQTLGLVGESGSGKSTTGKAVLGLIPFSGQVELDGREVRAGQSPVLMRPIRRTAQMIFQDPYASLDPRMCIGDAIAEPLLIHGIANASERRDHVAALLGRVGLSPDVATRYPHEFSGGQRQRICIARALALKPKLIVSDESVAALDVSVRAKVLDLMLELQEQLGLSYLFISHDMAVIERMSHQVAVMRGGHIVEIGSRRQIFENPADDYTRCLMQAVPIPDPRRYRQSA
ncbi:ABC transporter ATP-binding protein [Hylemonella gracilis]|uniref:Glutathione import ATP-binding protein GsiA n=1 Tax=Hylemonella gracilis TaxID=80880 RepID=A0A4P6UH95_9BURK|nr:ABC transporter ATP-binding protein [Hylemonella gracilis]QBK03674.1 ABC transporter ATP-binding protein [Hylemonella gracilis]